jgi:hypothetical protein
VVEIKNLDAGFGRGVGAIVLKGTRHFALQAAGAFVRIDVQNFLHERSPVLKKAAERMNSRTYESLCIALLARATLSALGLSLSAWVTDSNFSK